MSLSNVRPEFYECAVCAAKSGTPALCRECLERRELIDVVEKIRIGKFTLFDRVFSRLWHGDWHTEVPKQESVAEMVRICPTCNGTPDPECKEHGR